MVTPPYISASTKKLGITIARPVEGEGAGVVGGDISLEEIVDLLELRHVERNFVALFLEDISHGLCGRLRGAVGEAGDSGVDNIRAGFNSLLQCHRAEPRG